MTPVKSIKRQLIHIFSFYKLAILTLNLHIIHKFCSLIKFD
jgi:hypothetical protein